MLRNRFPYVIQPSMTGDIETDILAIYRDNQRMKTWAHVQQVAGMVDAICRPFGLDAQVCRISALCHDLAVIFKPADMLQTARQIGMEIDPCEQTHPFLLHQRFSVFLAEEWLGVHDERVLSAVGCHTTLKADPNGYDMALFLADKLAWDREGRPPYKDQVEAALKRSLEWACLTYMDFAVETGSLLTAPHRWWREASAWLRERCGR